MSRGLRTRMQRVSGGLRHGLRHGGCELGEPLAPTDGGGGGGGAVASIPVGTPAVAVALAAAAAPPPPVPAAAPAVVPALSCRSAGAVGDAVDGPTPSPRAGAA
eukprot:6499187-Prymnesium_polylepis.1